MTSPKFLPAANERPTDGREAFSSLASRPSFSQGEV